MTYLPEPNIPWFGATAPPRLLLPTCPCLRPDDNASGIQSKSYVASISHSKISADLIKRKYEEILTSLDLSSLVKYPDSKHLYTHTEFSWLEL